MSKTFFSIFLLLVFIFSILLSINIFYNAPLSSSINDSSKLRYFKNLIVPKTNNKIVYGFLPYWNLKDFSLEKEVTNLAFFGLDIDADGSISTKDADGNLDPGYRVFKSDEFLNLLENVKNQNSQSELVLKQFDNEKIENFLGDDKAQANFLQSLDSIILAYPISGINIDIEYSGDNATNLKKKFSLFIQELDSYLSNKYPEIKISVDVYANAAANQDTIWDINSIESHLDYIIVMAYDFHYRKSAQAGPVAPLFGDGGQWDKDINQNLKMFLDQAPREKILLGIPFYGYGWQTESATPNSNTYKDTGFTVSYKKAVELLKIANNEESDDETWAGVSNIQKGFDSDSLSPYINYQQDGNFYTIYYEDPESIAYKLEYARQLDLAGIAIWALGYEDSNRELWQAIADGI